VVVSEGSVEGWYRGEVRTHVAGAIPISRTPGEIPRGSPRRCAPSRSGRELLAREVAASAAAMGPAAGRGTSRRSGCGPRTRAAAGFIRHARCAVRRGPGARSSGDTGRPRARRDPRRGAPVGRGGRRKSTRRAVQLAAASSTTPLARQDQLDESGDTRRDSTSSTGGAFRVGGRATALRGPTHARVVRRRGSGFFYQRGELVADARAVGRTYARASFHRHFRASWDHPGRFSTSCAERTEEPTSQISMRERYKLAHEQRLAEDGHAHDPATLRLAI